MSVYTKTGDRGTTSLANGLSISKSDDRIELLGTIDELNSHIGLAKVLADSALKDQLLPYSAEPDADHGMCGRSPEYGLSLLF